MNQDRESTQDAQVPPAQPFEGGRLAPSAAERRRLLLKGVGRGGALIGATVPLKTLAGSRLLTAAPAHLCTVSGMQSGVHSASPGDSDVTCTGFTPSFFGQSVSNWPRLPNQWQPKATSCKTVFSRCTLQVAGNGKSAATPVTLFEVVSLPAYANTDDAHWVCAWLNALRGGGAPPNFPYTADQVMAYYKDSNANALTFFKGYMETLTR